MKNYYVYIMASLSTTLYVGVTNDLLRRVKEHREGKAGSFTQRYRITKLVYFEQGNDVEGAILREKQLKGWTRKRKLDLVSAENPRWQDLSEGWFEDESLGDLKRRQILHSVQNDKRRFSSSSLVAVRSANPVILTKEESDGSKRR